MPQFLFGAHNAFKDPSSFKVFELICYNANCQLSSVHY